MYLIDRFQNMLEMGIFKSEMDNMNVEMIKCFLFVSERINRVQRRGFLGGIPSEENACGGADNK